MAVATQLDLLTQIRDRLDEPTEGYWKNAELLRWLNEATKDIARKSEVFRTDATISVTSGTQSYTLPTNLVTILENSTYFKPSSTSQRYPLEPVDQTIAVQTWGVNQAITRNRPASPWGGKRSKGCSPARVVATRVSAAQLWRAG